MNSHLAVRIDGKFLALPEDASIDIEDSNPYFNDTQETWSLPFEVPIAENRHILGNIDDIQSDLRLIAHENKKMDVYADGIEFRSGKVATTEDQEINDKVTLSMTSTNKQLSDLYGDLTLQDITFPEEDKNDLQIGEMIGEVAVSGQSRYKISVYTEYYDEGFDEYGTYYSGYYPYVFNEYNTTVIESQRIIYPQALGFSVNKSYKCALTAPFEVEKDQNGNLIVLRDFINTNAPYGTSIIQPDGTTRKALYFNARVCYKHHKKVSDGTSGDEIDYDNDGYGPYYVLDADRPQSGICFYVLYVLKTVFRHLGLTYSSVEEADLLNVPDLCRLGFYTTKCKFNIEDKYQHSTSLSGFDFDYKENLDKNNVNKWLSDRKSKGKFKIGSTKTTSSEKEKYSASLNLNGETIDVYKGRSFYYNGTNYVVTKITASGGDGTFRYSANVSRMYANAENLPEMSVSSFVNSLWASFGIKFYYDASTNTVTPKFMRDILRDSREPIVMPGKLWTVHKCSEKYTGFSMKYSGESDRKEQDAFIRKGVTDYDTAYDYIVERSTSIVELPNSLYTSYYDLSTSVLSASNTTCYVDLRTGNAYRIKINKDGLDSGDLNALQPALFQVAQWHGVEIGYCSDDNEDFVMEVVSDFQPLDQNDVHWSMKIKNAKLCPFADDDMWNESVDMGSDKVSGAIRNVVESNMARTYYIDEIIDTDEKYDPKNTDDGNSPLQSHDWGNAICMMRGGGADARIDYYDQDYDGFGSYKIRSVAGDYVMDSDSISIHGEEYDYNGNGSDNGIGEGERFSLKIRAYHTNPKTGEIMCNNDKIARRGLYDRFMADYAHFVLNRKKITVTGRVNVIDIKNIQWDRRYNIGGVIGWINKISTHISAEKGIETCTFEMYVL